MKNVYVVTLKDEDSINTLGVFEDKSKAIEFAYKHASNFDYQKLDYSSVISDNVEHMRLEINVYDEKEDDEKIVSKKVMDNLEYYCTYIIEETLYR